MFIQSAGQTTNKSRPKDPLPREKTSGLVYLIPCRDCNYVYIGETGCRLSSRLDKHKSAVRKGYTDQSAVAEHVWSQQHQISWDNVEIVDHDQLTTTRRIREALHICRGVNLMNRDLGVEVSHIWDTLFSP